VRCKKSFTLWEVLIAAFILAFCVTGFFYGYIISAQFEKDINYRNNAILIAEDLIEQIRGFSFYDIVDAFDGAVIIPEYPQGYRGEVEIDVINQKLLEANVVVFWDINGNTGGPVELITYITNK